MDIAISSLDEVSPLPELDAVVTAFMRERDIHGGSLSVAREGRVVFARGYTLHEDPSGPIQPASLFRIASVSKPLCAVAVLQLVERGKLGLQDSVYELLGLQPLAGAGPDPMRIT